MSWIDSLKDKGATVTSSSVSIKLDWFYIHFNKVNDSCISRFGYYINSYSGFVKYINSYIDEFVSDRDKQLKQDIAANEALHDTMGKVSEMFKVSLEDELRDNGWVSWALNSYAFKYSYCSVPVISPSLDKGGEYIINGEKVSTYKDVARAVIKHLDEVAKPFREVLNEGSR